MLTNGGSYQQTAGSVNLSGMTYFSLGQGGSGGSVNISGGTLNSIVPGFIIANQGTSETMTVSGSGVFNQTIGNLSVYYQNGGSGTLTVSGSGQVNATSAIDIATGGGNGGSGTIYLSGGRHDLDPQHHPTTEQRHGPQHRHALLQRGRRSRRPTTRSGGLTYAYVQAGGAVLNTSLSSFAISQNLLHDPSLGATADGGLTKNGANTLTLTGSNTYTGPTMINAGTLQLGNSSALGSTAGGTTVAAGATLDLNGQTLAAYPITSI